MRAVRLVRIGEPLVEQQVPMPAVGDDEVLVRVKAAGICHSDAHYRAGTSRIQSLPVSLGHEVAGVIEQVGSGVTSRKVGDRVCLHYLVTCGVCPACSAGNEQFCATGQMLGKQRNGGYAEYTVVPARNAIPLPDEVPFEQGAIMMCSSATAFHALVKSGLNPGETVAIVGAGGLGMSAIQLARAFGALDVFVIDINDKKLAQAEQYGAIAVNAAACDPVAEVMRLTDGRGVDVALELVGLPQTMEQSVELLACFGRAVMVGITDRSFRVNSYRDLIGKEAMVLGSNDHLLGELTVLTEYVRRGLLKLDGVVTRTVPLQAGAINDVLDALDRFSGDVRVVITP